MTKFPYNWSHKHGTTFNMGKLVPVANLEVVQGSNWKMRTSAMIRCAPMTAPVMHATHVTLHHWFVPNRIIWDEFADLFITGGPAGVSAPTLPLITLPNSGAGGVVKGSLANYLGVPLGYNFDTTGYSVSALPFRAYALIWNDNYRDPDLETKLTIDLTSGPDTTTNTTLQNCAWGDDYFTRARPWPQKGTAVTLPLGTTAPIVSTGNMRMIEDTSGAITGMQIGGGNYQPNATTGVLSGGLAMEYSSGLAADLASASGSTITAQRLANAVQRLMENLGTGGSRFVEWLKSQGIRHSDASLQRPQYLGGGKDPIQFSEVLQTGVDSSDEGLANMGGHGIAAMSSNSFAYHFKEPGFVITMAYVRPIPMYTQAMARFWKYSTRLDFYQPELNFIGQQQILYRELVGNHQTPTGVLGYTNMYEHLRTQPDRFSSEFLDYYDNWHFGRELSDTVSLNGDFIKCVPSVEPFAVQNEDTLIGMFHHHIRNSMALPPNPKGRMV